jgi:hypothetical protein
MEGEFWNLEEAILGKGELVGRRRRIYFSLKTSIHDYKN